MIRRSGATNFIRDRKDGEVGRTMVAYRNDRHVEG